MPRVITTLQAMSHPTVVATISVLAEMSQRLQDENKELIAAVLAEREACLNWCAAYATDDGTAQKIAAAIRARSEVFTPPRPDRT